MKNLLNLTEEEKNRIRGLHLTESKDLRTTSVLSEQGYTPPCGERRLSITMNFRPGENTSHWKTWVIDPKEFKRNIDWVFQLKCLLRNGMAGDRPFIDIRGGTSATGNFQRNEEVMHRRIDTAFRELESALKIFKIKGDSGLPYSEEALREKSRIDRKYDVIEPGSKLPSGEQVPTDPNDPFFNDKQYVAITLNPTKPTPEYDTLADLFIKATKDDTLGTDEGGVYEILKQMRDKEDFREFQEELRNGMYKMDFYEIVCEGGAWPFGRVKELPRGDHEGIDSELRRLGVRPIPC